MSDKKSTANKSPKTTMDRTFLAIAQQLMVEHNIPSERSMSSELGQNVNFISRIKTGVQSVPADVWDTLINKFNIRQFTIVDEDKIAPSNVSRHINVVGVNHGTANQNTNYNPLDCERERDSYKLLLDKAQSENQSLRDQLARADALVAAKDEMLDLLRNGFNRPN
jgi:hypothetical protein